MPINEIGILLYKVANLRAKKPDIDFSKYDFQPVICNNLKSNGYFCNTWLGEIETSRPNISKHRCKVCKKTYQHIVHPDGFVECRETDDETPTTTIPAKAVLNGN